MNDVLISHAANGTETAGGLIAEILANAGEQGINQRTLAERAGISAETLSRLKKAGNCRLQTALDLAQPVGSLVAMLLPQDFDCAPGRADIMEGRLTLKLSLRRRPRWDWKERARPKHPPRRHLAWYLWDMRRRRATRLEWGP